VREAARLGALVLRCGERTALLPPRAPFELLPAARVGAGPETALDFAGALLPVRPRPARLPDPAAVDRRAAVRGVVLRRGYSRACDVSSSGLFSGARRELVPRR
jgi:hypothetical protein